MLKAVCPSLALSHPIPTRWRRVSDRPVVYNKILSFSIVDVMSELLVIENENSILAESEVCSPLLHGTEIYLVLK
jgi:hypothetical protein